MTPEEKLLALIQRDKRQETIPSSAVEPSREPEKVTIAPPVVPQQAAASVPVVPPVPAVVSPVPVAAPTVSPAAPAVLESVPPAPKVEPPAEKKIKLSARSEKPIAKVTEKPIVPVAEKEPAPAVAETKPAAIPQEVPVVNPVAAMASPVRVLTVRRGVGGLALVNRVLALVVLVLLVLVVYSVASIRTDVAKDVSTQVASAGTLPLAPLVVTSEAVPALDYYLDKVSGRNLFMPFGSPATTSVVSVVVGKAGDLKLVGVSVDESAPEESLAIIRNKADSKTHFVKVGQNVGDTGLTLARVLADRVILKSHKQEVELK